MYTYQLKLLDRDTNDELWSMSSPPTRVNYFQGNDRGGPWPCYISGHLAVVYLGHMVYGLDLAERKKLWEVDLFNSERHPVDVQTQPMLSLNAGALEITNARGTTDRLGQIGAVMPSFVCLRTEDALQAVDPINGNVLWTRSDLAGRTQIFGDDRTVYLVDTPPAMPRGDRHEPSAAATELPYKFLISAAPSSSARKCSVIVW